MKASTKPTIYQQAQRFADVTIKLIQAGHMTLAKRCLQEADVAFRIGTSEVRNDISNIYVFSVTRFYWFEKI